jgi:hypothetical protein
MLMKKKELSKMKRKREKETIDYEQARCPAISWTLYWFNRLPRENKKSKTESPCPIESFQPIGTVLAGSHEFWSRKADKSVHHSGRRLAAPIDRGYRNL